MASLIIYRAKNYEAIIKLKNIRTVSVVRINLRNEIKTTPRITNSMLLILIIIRVDVSNVAVIYLLYFFLV